ncbi:DUF5134 domain-containing protein [Mycobacterium paragordonae]|uniref:DUF5134 domain-containing protein n=1 Tax=Mycobacterium paragordonae TaxID=1389713 RepID=A0A4R5WZ60_9MYCO|nr:DUF5134 domain-containing protein [Mycobacterium paragordonae]MDP7737688.1 DUF5134 domain-containing protein [Mycobacterium paragordonae]TDL02369.1 DUF5134 domain-containing protein [Mycobacterium paragordonae]TDL12837.1 DUF5134 domain-containing protein [Mycobacterium paragordonae]
MIDDLPLRWVVTGLFLFSAVGFALVADRRSWTSVISHGLHVTMAVAMAAMAWPEALGLPPTPAEAFFLAAALWFLFAAVLAARVIGARLALGYHALKMVAMAWMYAAMGGHLTPEHPPMASMPSMPDMPDMPAMASMPEMEAAPAHTSHGWVTTVNWIWAAVFVLAAFAWSYLFITLRRRRGTRVWRARLANVVQATTAGGMAIMFCIMVFQA